MKRRDRVIAVVVLLLVAAPLSPQVQGTVVLRSGNLVMGEVQSLRRGTGSPHEPPNTNHAMIGW